MLTFEGRTGPGADVEYPALSVPAWWREAGLGLFVHWGIYSVPAFASPPGPRDGELDAYARHTYAEWYANTIRIPGSPAAAEHAARWGDRPYVSLLDEWHAEHFDADALARDAVAWGCRYLVLTTKHHDGCCLWDSATTDFTTAARGPRRDLVAEVVEACRRHRLRVGLYFSGALDWHVSDFGPITSDEELFAFRRNDIEFARYQAAQLDELVERFAPDLLWNDIDWPDAGKTGDDVGVAALWRRWLTRVPDGVTNDRWGVPARGHLTREYAPTVVDPGEPWEATRGIGHSFGINDAERPDDLLSAEELCRWHDDVRAAGGNVLVNVGLAASGEVPARYRERLDVLGRHVARHWPASTL